MKEVYIISFIEFRKAGQNVITQQVAFSTEEEALKLQSLLADIHCPTLSIHPVYENIDFALEQIRNNL
jgi:hypothetical protein